VSGRGKGGKCSGEKRLEGIRRVRRGRCDFDKLAAEQEKLRALASGRSDCSTRSSKSRPMLRLPPWDANVDTLSGGEKRRVALYPALSKPDMLLLDEPPALDAEASVAGQYWCASRHRRGGHPTATSSTTPPVDPS
jgi:sulfate-transporting ATPase